MTMTDAPAYLTVPELADLLRIKERKVYDLAASGEVPCARATGKLLFPRDEVEAWLAASSEGLAQRRPQVFLGSHDPLLEWALRQSRSGLATRFESSRDGLAAFARREGVATGLHLRAGDGTWNRADAVAHARDSDAVLVAWARRSRGLVIRAEDEGRITGPADLSGRRLARRQDGAGTEELWAQLLDERGFAAGSIGDGGLYLSEADAVAAVAEHEADAAFGLQSVSGGAGLAFVPVIEEHFDLLVSRRDWFEEPFQTLLAFVASDTFRQRARRMGGYDVGDIGRVLWNA